MALLLLHFGGLEDSTVELSGDRDASEGKRTVLESTYISVLAGYDVGVGVHTDVRVR